MSDIVKLPTVPAPAVVATPLTPVPAPTLEERAEHIRQAHRDIAGAVLTAVERGLDAGLNLIAAKDECKRRKLPWEPYVNNCGISMRLAQNWMNLGRHEDDIRQLLAERAHGHAYLTMEAALKFVRQLEASKKPKRRKKREPGRMLAIFGRR
jgi:hypothetical protein